MDRCKIRASESIDALRIITNAKQSGVIFQAVQQRPLQRVGVLEFIHQNMREAPGDDAPQLRVVPQLSGHHFKDVVEIQIFSLPLSGLITAQYAGNRFFMGEQFIIEPGDGF